MFFCWKMFSNEIIFLRKLFQLKTFSGAWLVRKISTYFLNFHIIWEAGSKREMTKRNFEGRVWENSLWDWDWDTVQLFAHINLSMQSWECPCRAYLLGKVAQDLLGQVGPLRGHLTIACTEVLENGEKCFILIKSVNRTILYLMKISLLSYSLKKRRLFYLGNWKHF